MTNMFFSDVKLNSYHISVQAVAATQYAVPKLTSKNLLLSAMADFLSTATGELKRARADNKLKLRNLD